MDTVPLCPEQSKYGAVETRDESKRCSELFRRHRDRIDGVIVTLPNFGDERAAAVDEATIRYLGWDMYWHQRPNEECS